MSTYPLPPTEWVDNPYDPAWAARDFLYTPDGNQEFPLHACKTTYLLSKPWVRRFRHAIDAGCRVGEFTRYLQLDFEHVYAFDPNLWPYFRFNVDLRKTTHFNCALGDERGEITMYGGMHTVREGVAPTTKPCLPLDDFGLSDVDYIKIDVEGFEKKVLLGARGIVERDNPVIVIEQNHVTIEGESQLEARAYLESIGYREVAVDPRGWDRVMVRDR